MGRSHGFGSTTTYSRPFQTRFRFGSSLSALTLHVIVTRWFILQKARRHFLSEAPTACKHTVSGSLSLPSRGSFHLSLTVLITIGRQGVFSLSRWSWMIPTGFHVPRGTRDPRLLLARFAYRGVTSFAGPFHDLRLLASRILQVPQPLPRRTGLGSSPFARRYLGNRFYFLFLQLLRCFTSLGCPP